MTRKEQDTSTWDSKLRDRIKRSENVVAGLTVRAVGVPGHMSVRLRSTRFGNGSCVFNQIKWVASNEDKIYDVCQDISRLLLKSKTFNEACEALFNREAANASDGDLNWRVVVDSLFEANPAWRNKTYKDHKSRAEKFLSLFGDNPPRDGVQVYRLYQRANFFDADGQSIGSRDSRRRHLDTIDMILERGVREFAADKRWVVTDKVIRKEVLEGNELRTPKKYRRPIKDAELATLLDRLKAEDSGLYCFVGFVSIYGIRPAEIAVLNGDPNGDPYVLDHVIKRNTHTRNLPPTPRPLKPLDIPGREGEGEKIWQMLRRGLVQLPPYLHNAIKRARKRNDYSCVGDAITQILTRDSSIWKEMAEATFVEGEGAITPYSMRHSFAWRGIRSYNFPIPDNIMALWMGNTPKVFKDYYGSYASKSDADRIYEMAVGINQKRPDTIHSGPYDPGSRYGSV